MWRLIIIAVALASNNASGQGKVAFANDSNHLFVLYGNPLPVSPLPSGHTLLAALYAGTTAGNLSLQTIVTLDASGWLSPGRMATRNVTLANVAGGTTAYFQIFIMDTGTTRPSTIVGGAGQISFPNATYFGTSGLFTAIPGSSLTFPNLANHASSTWPAGSLEASGCLSCHPPWFVTNPSNSVVSLGGDASLNALAHSAPLPFPISTFYQWRKQGSPIDGATSSYLTLRNVTLSDAGNYDVVASNVYGSRPSAVATVTVFVPVVLGSPTYSANNQFQFTVTGTPGTNYIVQVSTNLSHPQWLSVVTNASPFTFIDTTTDSFPHRFFRTYFP